ncbi:MAG: N-acetylneuraminic acid synthase [Vicingaceae bacterium]|nr:MAG: N-acetylneuraminic acid synthase [Vicingaceae bacterium]
MKISNFDINEKVLIVAELSANHGQDIRIAKDTIYAMKEAGADAVKLQTYTPDTMTIDSSNDYFQIKYGTLWDGITLYNLYQEAYTPWEWHHELKELTENLGMIFFSTPFDKTSVDFLETLNVPAYKIASFEITDLPLIEYAASKGKPMIISTGIATLCEIQEAVDTCKKVGNDQIVLLKCTSAYPAPYDEINLRTIPNLKETFGVEAGLSDHTLGTEVPVAAVALGARIIEKHFILDKSIDSPDKEFSLTPGEFKNMVDAVRNIEKALGKITYELTEKSKKSRVFGRSLFIVKDIHAGEILTEDHVRSIRPGVGLAPKYLSDVIGKKVRVSIKKGTPLSWDLLE